MTDAAVAAVVPAGLRVRNGVGDDETQRQIERAIRCRHGRGPVEVVSRPSEWATSRRLARLDARLHDGDTVSLMAKQLGRDGLIGEARRVKPDFIVEHDVEGAMYTSVLDRAGLGTPAFYGLIDGSTGDGNDKTETGGGRWLLIERVDGRELHSCGNVEAWQSAARWVAQMHSRFPETAASLAARWPWLIRYDSTNLSSWSSRLAGIGRRRWPETDRRRLEELLSNHPRVVPALLSTPTGLVHGELYSSNVLVEESPAGPVIRPIDWETAGIGPMVMDLACLTSGGWSTTERRDMAVAYLDAGGLQLWRSCDDLMVALDLAYLQLAVQWLAWAEDWQPPARNDCDWLAVAAEATTRLGF
jgi:hypothetical protein